MRYEVGRFRRPMRRSTEGQLVGLVDLGDGSTLSLDFTAMSGLDSRFTFSRASTATFINSSGLVESAANGVARFDHDPATLAPRGLLIEGSATNLALQSDTLPTPTNWVANSITRTNVSTVTPDGNTTATTCGLSHTGSGSFRSATITVTASTAYTFSFWAKNNGGSVALYRAYNVSGSADIVAETSYFSQINGSTWTRVRFTFTTPVGCTSVYVYPLSQSSGTSNVLIWGAQLEAGSGASSYTPTGSGTVQRAADVCYIGSLPSFGFNVNGGTVLVEYNRKEHGSGSGYVAVFDWGASPRVLAIGNPIVANSAVRATGWNTNISQTGTATANGINRVAASYGAFGGSTAPVALSVNGQAATTGTFDYDASQSRWLSLGQTQTSAGSGNADFLNNCVRRLKYWPTRLPDATLQSLTQ